MRFTSIISVSILAVSFWAHAEDSAVPTKNEVLTGGMTLVGTQQTNLPQPTVEKSRSTWNFNLGMSQFDQSNTAEESLKGQGLTIELQRRLGDIFYIGGSYTNYKVDTQFNQTYSHGASYVGSSKSIVDVFNLSLEAHMIRLPLPGKTEFFTAVSGGYMVASSQGQVSDRVTPSFYYGAGVGVNFRNQLGLRADLRSNRDFSSFSSVSLVGYY